MYPGFYQWPGFNSRKPADTDYPTIVPDNILLITKTAKWFLDQNNYKTVTFRIMYIEYTDGKH
jgi:hypothetical protein